MSLYVRLQTSFFTHRKTARLRAKLGDDALWLVPRLWCYAAENQPDGDFSKYEPAELALLIGYNKDASRMLEALQQAEFLEGMKIHGWDEHNGYHAVFSDRAKKAAKARWAGNEKKGQERKGKETSNASSMATPKKGIWTLVEIEASGATTGAGKEVCKAFFDSMESVGWVDKHNRPIRSMQAALAIFSRHWTNNLERDKKNGTNKNGSSESTRNIGTANEGRSHLYAGVGKIKPNTDNGLSNPK